MKTNIILERGGIRFVVTPQAQDIHNRPLRYNVNKFQFKGLIHIAFVDRWGEQDPQHRSIKRFMEASGFVFRDQGQVWEIPYTPSNWSFFQDGQFDECLQSFWKNPRRHSGWDFIRFDT